MCVCVKIKEREREGGRGRSLWSGKAKRGRKKLAINKQGIEDFIKDHQLVRFSSFDSLFIAIITRLRFKPKNSDVCWVFLCYWILRKGLIKRAIVKIMALKALEMAYYYIIYISNNNQERSYCSWTVTSIFTILVLILWSN